MLMGRSQMWLPLALVGAACVEVNFQDGTGGSGASTSDSSTSTSTSTSMMSTSMTSSAGGAAAGAGGLGADGGQSSSSTTDVSNTMTATGAGGVGGAPSCESLGLAPAVSPCGIAQSFADESSFLAEFDINGTGLFEVENGALRVEGSSLTWAESTTTFEFVDCAQTIKIVELPQEASTALRLSVGSMPGVSLFNITVQNGQVRGRNDVFDSVETPFDPATMSFLRMRAASGEVFFGTSLDGDCWEEFGSLPFAQAVPGMSGRITFNNEANLSDSFRVDDYCIN